MILKIKYFKICRIVKN